MYSDGRLEERVEHALERFARGRRRRLLGLDDGPLGEGALLLGLGRLSALGLVVIGIRRCRALFGVALGVDSRALHLFEVVGLIALRLRDMRAQKVGLDRALERCTVMSEVSTQSGEDAPTCSDSMYHL